MSENRSAAEPDPDLAIETAPAACAWESPRRASTLRFPPGYVRGVSVSMETLYRELSVYAESDLSALILGETGVGKELVARMLHESSAHRRGPFQAVNCAAIPVDLLEAEMFGVARRVATGVAERPGRFQLADGGTLFLDEIGDMHPALQAKLLRALQEGAVEPLGGELTPVRVRVVAASNQDLPRRIAEGAFRADLYYRIAGCELRVPALRERPEDIAPLTEGFLRQLSERDGKPVRGVSARALELLEAWSWPGNVRELQNLVRRLFLLCPPGGVIRSADLPDDLRARRRARPGRGEASPPADSDLNLRRQIESLERRLVGQALDRAEGNRSRAAKLLGISRNGLALKVERLGLA